MARRKATRRPRRSRAVSLLNLAESYAYTSILTEGLFSASPAEFILGQGDLAPSSSWTTAGVMSAYTNNPDAGAGAGANPLSLRDIFKEPGYAFSTIQARGQANMINMAISSAMVGISARLAKRVLRRPIANVNKNIFKTLSLGVRL
jgi:hypothetical protein|tara:strand:+ start:22 stop:462 length:441 start_codon:yes stop_codon:yes gene_type:complete